MRIRRSIASPGTRPMHFASGTKAFCRAKASGSTRRPAAASNDDFPGDRCCQVAATRICLGMLLPGWIWQLHGSCQRRSGRNSDAGRRSVGSARLGRRRPRVDFGLVQRHLRGSVCGLCVSFRGRRDAVSKREGLRVCRAADIRAVSSERFSAHRSLRQFGVRCARTP